MVPCAIQRDLVVYTFIHRSLHLLIPDEDNKEELIPGEEVGKREVFLTEKLSGAVFRLRKERLWNEKEK